MHHKLTAWQPLAGQKESTAFIHQLIPSATLYSTPTRFVTQTRYERTVKKGPDAVSVLQVLNFPSANIENWNDFIVMNNYIKCDESS